MQQGIAEALVFPALVLVRIAFRKEAGGPHQHLVGEGAGRSLGAGIDAIPHRSTLHENDGMVSVLSRYRGGKTHDIAGLGAAGDPFKTLSGEVMTFIEDQLAVVAHEVKHFAFFDETLNQRDIENSC